MKNSIVESYECSVQQKRLWNLEVALNKRLYNQLSFTIRHVPVDTLISNLRRILEHNELFRTIIDDYQDVNHPIQGLQEYSVCKFDIQVANSEAEVYGIFKKKDFNEGLDSAVYIKLYKLNVNETIILISARALYLDVWSIKLIIKQALEINGDQIDQDELTHIDYSEWQNSFCESNDIEDNEHWKNVKNSGPQLDRVKTYLGGFERQKITKRLNEETFKKIKSLCQSEGICLESVLLTCYLILIKKLDYSQSLHVCYSGRNRKDVANILGPLAKYLPLQLEQFDDDMSFLALINSLEKKNSLNHTYAEFYDLSKDKKALDCSFAYINTFFEDTDSNVLIRNEEINSDLSTLELIVKDQQGHLELCFNYIAGYLDHHEVEKIVKHYTTLVDHFVRNPYESVSESDLDFQEYAEFSKKGSINETENLSLRLEHVVSGFPDKVAFINQGSHITYSHLNNMAKGIANNLHQNIGIKQGDIVAGKIRNQEEAIILYLATIKLGAVFLLIDEGEPIKRVKWILEDSKPSIFVTEAFADKLSNEVLQLKFSDLNKGYGGEYEPKLDGDSPAYLIYTSGTTGQPKGVLGSHGALMNYVKSLSDLYNINHTDYSILTSSLAFDLSYTSFWVSLLQGGTLCLIPKANTLDNKLIQALNNYPITFAKMTPSLFNLIVTDRAFEQQDSGFNIRLIFLGGEAIRTADIEKYFDKDIEVTFINHYGPTETTVGVLTRKIDRKSFLRYQQKPTIGFPLNNVDVFLKNDAPVRSEGQICVRGMALSIGYLNSPDLTKKKFIFSESNGKYFETGDIGRLNWNGEIQIIGRQDNQYKINGYRIGIEEIESVLNKLPYVTKSAVVVKVERKESHLKLIGYLEAEELPEYSQIRTTLEEHLPVYMIPSKFIKVKTIPLNNNGKINRSVLITIKGVQVSGDFIAPKTEVQSKIAAIWCQVLNLDKVGIDDNFFNLGGDSIMAIRIASRIQAEGYKLMVPDVLRYPTIKVQAKKAEKINKLPNENTLIESGIMELTPIQKEFFERYRLFEESYCQSLVFNIKGEVFDVMMLQKIMHFILKSHDAFRLKFIKGDGQIEAEYDKMPSEFKVSTCKVNNNYSAEDIKSHLQRLERLINISQGILIKCEVIEYADTSSLILMAHHLIMDAVSWNILLDDIKLLVNQSKNGEELHLPQKTVSFKEWSDLLDSFKKAPQFGEDANYWNAMFDKIKIDRYSNNAKSRQARTSSFSIPHDSFWSLRKKAALSVKGNVQDLLIAGISFAYEEHFNTDNLLVALESHGRENSIGKIDIGRTIGCFTSIFPIEIKLGDPNLIYRLKNIKEQIRRVPNKGVSYGLYRYANEELKNKLNLLSYKVIRFNYLGEINRKFSGNLNATSTLMFQSSPKTVQEAYFIDISAMTIDGELKLAINYDSTELNESFIEMFYLSFEKNLSNLLQVCSEVHEIQYTPSDYNIDISVNELDELLKHDDILDIYSLTALQKGMLFHDLFDQSKNEYVVQTEYSISSEIDVNSVEKTLLLLSSKHNILRTRFFNNYDQPVQVVNKEPKSKFKYFDISSLSKQGKEEYLIDFRKADVNKGFDLNNGYCFRVTIIKVSDKQYKLFWTNHHIILDGWSRQLFVKEFFDIYDNLHLNSQNIPNISNTPQFKDYIHWLNGQYPGEAYNYYKNYLSGYQISGSIPKTSQIQHSNSYKHNMVKTRLDKIELRKLKNFAAQNQVTLNSLINSAWGVLLGKYNGTNDVIFGSVVAGRPSEINHVESILGLFINTQPVRVNFERTETVQDLLLRIHNNYIESERFQHFPLTEIQNIAGQHELIDHLVVFENFPNFENESKDKKENGFKVSALDTYDRTNYDFNLIINVQDEIKIRAFYNELKYSNQFVEILLSDFTDMIMQIIETTSQIENLKLKSLSTSNDYLIKLDGGDDENTEKGNIIAQFKQTVSSHSNKIALSNAGGFITYNTLDLQSDIIAQQLLNRHIRREELVGIFLNDKGKSIELLLGILKAGGAFVLIDSTLPHNRIEYVINDLNCRYVITDDISMANWQSSDKSIEVIDYVSLFEIESINENQVTNSINHIKSNELAYVIYTSGSTGNPKGVMIEHCSVVNMSIHQIQTFGVNSRDRILQFASFSFDAAISELFMVLFSGAALHLISKEKVENSGTFTSELQNELINVVTLPPSYIKLIDFNELPALKVLITAGEQAISRSELNLPSSVKYFNAFGPAECTVCVSIFEEIEGIAGQRVSIGIPLPNTNIFLSSKGGKVLPEGFEGELAVSGLGLARGYLNNIEKTFESFGKQISKSPVYLTGDICSYFNGKLYYKGRKDDQIKVRGIRVHLSELETVLMQNQYVYKAKVLRNKNDQLVAFVEFGNELCEEDIKPWLKSNLPIYLVPDRVIKVDNWPISINGKIDNSELLMSYINKIQTHDFQPPQTQTERKLVDIIADILKADRVGRKDNFFDLGGHSLKAIQMVSRINNKFDIRISMKAIFNHPVIADLAVEIEALQWLNEDSEDLVDRNKIYI